METNDPLAMFHLGNMHAGGMIGLPKDAKKSAEFFLRSGDLGYALSYGNLVRCYCNGEGVERDIKKAIYYCELASIGGMYYRGTN